MSDIVKKFEEKLAKEEIKGISKWIFSFSWQDRNLLFEYEKAYSKETNTISSIQRTMLSLVRLSCQSVLDLKEIGLELEKLSEIELSEILSFYDLEKPEKRYKEIKADIASPESFLTRIPYTVIKALYEKGKVPFDRQIFIACLIRFNVWHGGHFKGELNAEYAKKLDKIFPKDDFTLDILMAVFEMELKVDGAFYLERDLNIGAIILHLVKENTLDKAKVQQKIFEAFNNPTLKQSTQSWVKNVYDRLKFTKEENLACQAQLIELLHNDVNLVSNYSLKILKQISTEKTFDWSFFIDSLDGIVYRKKFNGGLKLALGMLYKKLKKDDKKLEKTCLNLAPIFLQEENSIQAEAVKIFSLLKTKNEEISDALDPFISTMHSETKSALAFLLSGENLELENAYETYVQEKYTPEPIQNLEKLNYIEKEEDFIFLCSKVLKSQDALDYELFLEALLRFYHIKDTQKKALGSALKMARRMTESMHIEATAREGVHHIFVAKIMCIWLDDKELTIAEEITNWTTKKGTGKYLHDYTKTRFLGFYKLLGTLNFVAQKIRNKEKATLLSTPTHTNGYIDIDVFFERLYVYEQNKIAINESDFNLAICRLNKWSKYKKAKEYKSEYRDVLSYILDEKTSFNPKKIKQLENIWFAAFIIKNQDKSTQAIDFFLTKKADWWTAKTKDIFKFGMRYSDSSSYKWAKIDFEIDFTNDYEKKVEVNHFAYYLLNYEFIIADASHWFLKNGYYLEPLYLSLILKNYNYLSEMEARESKSTMATLLESIKNPLPLAQNGMMFLCLSLFAGNTTVRSTALEWLLELIERKYLDLNLFTKYVSQMLSNEHHPFPIKRVSEQFEQLNQMGGTYNDVLHQTLQEILTKINPENLPKSFKNILHFYYEIINKTQTEIPFKIKENLETMLKQNAVKKEVKKILAL